MESPLVLTEAKLGIHFKSIAGTLAGLVDSNAIIDLSVDSPPLRAVAGLVGAGCEYVVRNRGLRAPVAPLLPMRNEVWAWLGYREEWEEEQKGKVRRFSFRSSGVTIHLGKRNEAFKPQVFRAEWAGFAKWNDGKYSFQAADAGHPHWQFDAVDTIKDTAAEESANTLRGLLLEGEQAREQEPAEFVPPKEYENPTELLFAHQLSRIHFPSAATWWLAAPNDMHAHCPSQSSEIQRWLQKTVAYVRVELGRLS